MADLSGSVLVVGGGISGVQAALDLADSGFYVHLVERGPAIGGAMSQLDKTFPTNDCSACILSPKLVECGRHLNINLLTLSQVEALEGGPGRFKVRVRQMPRYVDTDKCIACGACAEKCPKKVPSQFDLGLGTRKAIYLQYPQAVPLKYAIDPEQCIWLRKPGRCGACVKACPSGAINFDDKQRVHDLTVGSVILAPGFRPFDPSGLDFLGYKSLDNVITSMEFERILSPSGPFKGHMVRPSDGKEPRRIAWLQCVGSRDINRACHGYCSSVCCMYAVKQAFIAREHAKGQGLDTEIFFMDMRTHGKGFESYYQRARQEGILFRRARVHTILPDRESEGGLVLTWGDEEGKIHESRFDMVVLSVGLEPDPEVMALSERLGVELDPDMFVLTEGFSPVATSRPGIFVCGAASEPKDIPQSVMEASAAALEAERLLSPVRWSETKTPEYPPERDVFSEPPRIGVFVCSCGINIGSVVDVERVCDYAKGLPGVVFAQTNLFTCSQDTINQMAETVRRQRLNRVVVASCTPRTHEPLFQETLREAGINKYLFEMANIRDQDSWVHQSDPEAATRKAMDLVRMAVAKVRGDQPLAYNTIQVIKEALVVGGGVAGMTAALSLADQGFPVTLVEREARLGGWARSLFHTSRREPVQEELASLISKVEAHSRISVKTGVTVKDVSGSVGRFSTSLSDGSSVEHGVAIVAVGAEPWLPEPGSPHSYLYGVHPGVRTLLEVDQALISGEGLPEELKQAVFIHCVGSRIPERPYCSRVCCSHAIEQALALKDRNPDLEIFMLYRDIRTYGRREYLYQEARRRGIIFIRYDLEEPPQAAMAQGEAGQELVVRVKDHVLGRPVELRPELLVLATAITPRRDSGALAQFFKCATGSDGFLLEAHMKLRPVDFATDGVFLAGLCHYPKPIEETIAQAKAAASRAGLILSKDHVPAESITAEVNRAKCTGCGVCERVCAYHAVAVDPASGSAVVDSAMCKGCGACVAGCRSDAITLKNMGNEQIMAEVEAVVDEWIL